MGSLLAVDLGLKMGLALYGPDGRLRWYRSHNLGTTRRLRKAIYHILKDIDDLAWLIMEGGGNLADIWAREADRRGIPVRVISAEEWRCRFFIPRDRQSGMAAKKNAGEMARRIIAWSGAKRPTSLRHDAAEAILVGLWGVLEVGLLDDIPDLGKRE